MFENQLRNDYFALNGYFAPILVALVAGLAIYEQPEKLGHTNRRAIRKSLYQHAEYLIA